MPIKTCLDEFGIQVEQLVFEALEHHGRDTRDFFAIQQHGDSLTTLSPKVTLRLSNGLFRTFRIRYEHQVMSSADQVRDLVSRYIQRAYQSGA